MILVIVRPYNMSYLSLERNRYQRYVIYIGSTDTGGRTREKRNVDERPRHEEHGGHDRCEGNLYDVGGFYMQYWI